MSTNSDTVEVHALVDEKTGELVELCFIGQMSSRECFGLFYTGGSRAGLQRYANREEVTHRCHSRGRKDIRLTKVNAGLLLDAIKPIVEAEWEKMKS